jgi:hypothetical protein
VEHSGAPVTNDSYTEEDEFKAVGADMRINGVDAIYKECTFEPIYQKDPDLYANASAVYKNVIEQQNKDILSGLHGKEQVPFKSDLQLGAQVNRKFSDAVYDSVICLNTYNGAEGAPGEEVDASRENPISYTPYSSVGDTKSPTVISKCPETVNRDMIEFLLSVIRPIGAISRYKTDSVTNTTVQSIFYPMDIDVINVVLRDILYGLGLNKKQYRGICDVKKSLYERLELCENLNITKLLDKKINASINTAVNAAVNAAYNEMPIGNTVSIPRCLLWAYNGNSASIRFSYNDRLFWCNMLFNGEVLQNRFCNTVYASKNGYNQDTNSLNDIIGIIYAKENEKLEIRRGKWADMDNKLKREFLMRSGDPFVDAIFNSFFTVLNQFSDNRLIEYTVVDDPYESDFKDEYYYMQIKIRETVWWSQATVSTVSGEDMKPFDKVHFERIL